MVCLLEVVSYRVKNILIFYDTEYKNCKTIFGKWFSKYFDTYYDSYLCDSKEVNVKKD